MENLEEILKSEKPVFVEFFATWCGHCQMMAPVIESLRKNIGCLAEVVKFDIDKNEGLADYYEVKTVPTMMIFKNGELKWRKSGYQSEESLEKEIRSYL